MSRKPALPAASARPIKAFFDGSVSPSAENVLVRRAGLARPSTTRRHRQSWKIHP